MVQVRHDHVAKSLLATGLERGSVRLVAGKRNSLIHSP
jgi:hypothetical protein